MRKIAPVLLLLISSVAYGQVAFHSGKYVYTVPDQWSPPNFGPGAIEEIQKTAARLHFPFYVVITDHLSDLNLPLAGSDHLAAASAINGIINIWSHEAGYDLEKSSVFLLSYSPRVFRLLAGPEWQRRLNLRTDELVKFTSQFVLAVRDRPQDPKKGIVDMMQSMDKYIFENTDSRHLAARADAERVKNEHRHKVVVHAAEGIGGGIASLCFLIFIIVSRRKYELASDIFERELKKWKEMADNAENKLASWYADKSDITVLEGMQGKTKRLRDEVVSSLDDIYLSIKGIQAHLNESEKLAGKATIFNVQPLDAAYRLLGNEFTFDTEQINKDDLFGSDTKKVTVTIEKFAREQADRFRLCQQQIDKLKEASAFAVADEKEIDRRLISRFRALKEKAENIKDYDLSAYLYRHPFAQKEQIASNIKSLRDTDPVMALESLNDINIIWSKYESDFDHMLDALVELSHHTNVKIPNIDGTVVSHKTAPISLLKEAESKRQDLARQLKNGSNFNEVNNIINDIKTGYHQAFKRAENILAAKKKAPIVVEEVKTEEEASKRVLDEASRVVIDCSRRHSLRQMSKINHVLQDANNRQHQAHEILNSSIATLATNRHTEAVELAQKAKSIFAQAKEHAHAAISYVNNLDEKKRAFEVKRDEMKQLYEKQQAKCKQYGSVQLLPVYNPPMASTYIDYDLAIAEMMTQQMAWQSAVNALEVEQVRSAEVSYTSRSDYSDSNSDSSYDSGSSWSSGSDSSSGGDFGGGSDNSSGGSW